MTTPTSPTRPIADGRTPAELHNHLSTYRLNGDGVPDWCQPELLAYLTTGTPTGTFLRAVISNDLAESLRRATRFADVPPVVAFLYNHAHPGSWGSPEAYAAWTSSTYSTKPAAALPLTTVDNALVQAEGSLLVHFLRAAIQTAFDNEEAFLSRFFPQLSRGDSLEEFYMDSEHCHITLNLGHTRSPHTTTIPTQNYLSWVESLGGSPESHPEIFLPTA